MTVAARQQRVRVLEALETRIKQFRRREELWPLRVPHEPLLLEDVIEEALGDSQRRFDPTTLRSRTLLQLAWDDNSTWEVWVTVLPSKLKVFCDSSHGETRVLASGGKNEGDETDRLFLELLGESGGQHFGIEMSGGAPSRVRSSIADRTFLIDVFVNLFEVSGMEAAIRDSTAEPHSPPNAHGLDFRGDVERWLARVMP
jgi:hypothetical protein